MARAARGRAGDYRRAGQRHAAGQAIPGWGMLVIGVIVGLFIAFLVYLSRLDEPVAGAGSDTPTEVAPAEKPRFEFYSILPELEVVIPDILSDKVPAAPRAGAGEDNGRVYYLQAGSFRSDEEADRMKASLALLGLDVMVQTVSVNGTRWHRVRVGPLASDKALRAARARLREHNIDFMVLKTSK